MSSSSGDYLRGLSVFNNLHIGIWMLLLSANSSLFANVHIERLL